MIIWGSLLSVTLYAYFFHTEAFHVLIESAVGVHLWWAYLVFFLLGSLRGFTFIPSTYLIVLGFFFFDPLPLYLFLIAGIMVSSASIYHFSHLLGLDDFFEKKHFAQITWIKKKLTEYELPIIIGWSFMLFLPTDLLSYVCGSLRINFHKFLLGVFIGESLVCAVYIFGAQYFLDICGGYSWCFL